MKSFIFCLLLLTTPFVQASTITSSFSTNPVFLNDKVSIDLIGYFTDKAIVGGIVDVSYDTNILSRVSTDFDTGVWLPSFSRAGIDSATGIDDLEFGRFFFDLNPSADTGPVTIATLMFDAIGIGQTDIFLSGSLAESGVFEPITLDLDLGSVEVSAVPLPASAWLFGSAFLGLFGMGKRKSERNTSA